MIIRKFIFLILLFFIPLVANNLVLTQTDQKTIKDIGTVTVGVIDDMPPLEYYGVGYKHQGIISDFLRIVSKKLNLNLKYISSTHANLYNLVLKKRIDMMSYGIKSNKNKNALLFTSPFLEVDNAIFTLSSNPVVNHTKDLANSLVGIKYDNYYLETVLKDKYPDMSFRFVNSKQEAIKMLLSGELETFIGDLTTTDYIIQRHNLSNEIKTIHIPWLKTPIRFAVSKNNPKLHKLLQKAIESINYETHNEIVEKWLHDEYRYNKLPLFLSKEEIQWIKKHQKLTVGVSKEWRPFSYHEKGKHKGVISGYLNIVSKKTGINFIYKEFESFSDMLEASARKEIDIIDAIAASKKRKKNMLFSDPYLKLDSIIAINKNQEKINSINDLANKKVGSIKGYITGIYLKSDIPSAKVIEYKSVKKGLQALSNGELDAFIMNLPMFDFYTAEYEITNIIVSCGTPYTAPVSFGIKKDEKILKSIIDKALDTISEEDKNEIYRKWIRVEFAQKIDYEMIWKIVAIFLLFLLGALYWNRKLSQEIDKRNIVERELILAKVEAEKATQAKSIFLANMSHEIRTPMNSVIGFADLLDDLITDPTQKGYLHSIKVGGKALLEIINDILDLSKIEAGKLKIRNESVNIHNIFLEMRHLFHDKIAQKNLTLHIHIQPDVPKFLIIDGVRVRQILLNLVGNAIKFTDKGKISINAKCVFKDANKSTLDFIFSVSDTGIGIPKKDQQEIFGDFIQREKQSIKKYGGTGLGLSICKRLVQIMNGKIDLTSKEEEGSTFTIHLNDVNVSTLKEDSKEELYGKVEFLKSTILVVDDVDENRELVKAIFSDTPLMIKEAKNGKEAVEETENGGIDLIFMDLQMPIMDGYEATKRIREKQSKEQLSIIALTASVMGEELEKIPQFGFNDYLRKPASKRDIIQKASLFLPHDKIDTKKSFDTITFDTQEAKDTFVEKLSGELFEQWNRVKDKGDIELIKELNNEFIKLLQIQDIKIFRKYTQDISICVESFDLVQMYNLMGEYPSLIENIKNSEVR